MLRRFVRGHARRFFRQSRSPRRAARHSASTLAGRQTRMRRRLRGSRSLSSQNMENDYIERYLSPILKEEAWHVHSVLRRGGSLENLCTVRETRGLKRFVQRVVDGDINEYALEKMDRAENLSVGNRDVSNSTFEAAFLNWWQNVSTTMDKHALLEHGAPAGLPRRCLANFLDASIITMFYSFLVDTGTGATGAYLAMLAYLCRDALGYSPGVSVGKSLLGMEVVRVRNLEPCEYQISFLPADRKMALARSAWKVALFGGLVANNYIDLPYFWPDFWTLFEASMLLELLLASPILGKSRMGIGELLTNTMVVRAKRELRVTRRDRVQLARDGVLLECLRASTVGSEYIKNMMPEANLSTPSNSIIFWVWFVAFLLGYFLFPQQPELVIVEDDDDSDGSFYYTINVMVDDDGKISHLFGVEDDEDEEGKKIVDNLEGQAGQAGNEKENDDDEKKSGKSGGGGKVDEI